MNHFLIARNARCNHSDAGRIDWPLILHRGLPLVVMYFLNVNQPVAKEMHGKCGFRNGVGIRVNVNSELMAPLVYQILYDMILIFVS